MKNDKDLKVAVFGSGCFWCSEAIFKQVRGVDSVVPGYAGGFSENPTYKEVCNDTTGHAEVIKIEFDPSVISFGDLLDIFWETHDPTTLNRQGNDIGSQYRSIVLFADETQKEQAEQRKAALDVSEKFEQPIVTEISPLGKFYEAEDYHHDYYAQNKLQPYCQFVISPKLTKFKKKFSEKIA